jgi:hypothetical protein
MLTKVRTEQYHELHQSSARHLVSLKPVLILLFRQGLRPTNRLFTPGFRVKILRAFHEAHVVQNVTNPGVVFKLGHTLLDT